VKHARWVASAIVLFLLIYAARRVDWRTAAMIIRRAALGPLAAAVVINLASLAVRGVRWWVFLRRVGTVKLAVAMRGTIVGSGLDNLLIANAGEAARVLLVSRASGVSRRACLATLLLDRVLDPLCFALLLFVATFVIPLPAQLSSVRVVAGVASVLVVGLLAVLVYSPARTPPSPASAPLGPPNAQEPLDSKRLGLRAHLAFFRGLVENLATVPRITAALLLSIVFWALQLATFALVARSVSVALPLGGNIAAMLLTSAGLILRVTPGNVGYFQFAYVLAAARFGVHTEAAVAAALLLQIVQIVPVTLLATALAPRMLMPARRGTAR
jgi:glycosyltransferase 2 family protein